MRLSFAKQAAPLIAGVIREKTVREAIARIKRCEIGGATGIDLHLSCLNDEFKNEASIKQIVNSCSLPILALNYNQDYEYNGFDTEEEPRVELLKCALSAGVAALDIQGYTFDKFSKTGFREEFSHLDYSFIKDKPKEVVLDPVIIDKQTALIDEAHSMGAEVLLSCHPDVVMDTMQVVELALFLEKRKPDIIKIITRCENEYQLAEAFKTMVTLKNEVETRVHFHCSGKAGKLSRIINPLIGGYLVFCNESFTASSNFEQLDLKTAVTAVDSLKKLM